MDIQKIYEEGFNPDEEYLGKDKGVNQIEPLVSVCTATYQHVKYIEDCIEGILMQKTEFPIEIIIGEDESTDGTREICKKYAEKYPDKIRLFLRDRDTSCVFDENGKRIFGFNGKWARKSARGKYIALCEGDDHWTDPQKLQKQVKFMKENEDYIGCFTNYRMVNEKGEVLLSKTRPDDHIPYYDRLSMLEGGVPQTCTVMYKNLPEVFDQVAKVVNVVNGDQVLAEFMAQEGKIKFLKDVTADRRVGSGTFSTLHKSKQKLAGIKTFTVLKKYFKKPEELECLNRRINKLYIELILTSVKNFNINNVIIYERERLAKTGLPFNNKISTIVSFIVKGITFRIKRNAK